MNKKTWTKKGIVDALKQEVIQVSFTKMDGTLRDMQCTLLPEYLPEAEAEVKAPVENPRHLNDNIISAWDIEKDAWRSFRVDSVIDIILLVK